LEGVRYRNARDRFKHFEDAIRKNMFRNRCKRVLIAWSLQAFTGMHFITGLKAVDTGFVLLTAGQLRTTA
jgi:hypothetical protein